MQEVDKKNSHRGGGKTRTWRRNEQQKPNKEEKGKKPVLRIRDVYPGSRILIFTHPGSRIQKQQQKRGVKKNLCSHKFHKIANYFSFEVLKKKI